MTFHILQTPTLDYRYNSAETDHSEGDEIPKFLTNYVKQDDESNEKETEKLLIWMQQLTQEEEELPDVSKIFSQSSSLSMSQDEEEAIMLSQEEKEQEEEEKEFFHLDNMEEDDEDPDEIMNAIMESQAIFESHENQILDTLEEEDSIVVPSSSLQTLSYPMAERRRKRWKRRTRVQNHDENSFKVVIKVLRRKSCD